MREGAKRAEVAGLSKGSIRYVVKYEVNCEA